MVTEFYKNLQVRQGAEDVAFITTVVNGKALLLDHVELGKAMKLSNKVINLPILYIKKEFVFNKMELKLFLSVMCGIEVPHNLFTDDSGISFEHFIPVFQTLALIMRGNIYPSTCGTKLMHFAELKLMYKLASHKVAFNLPYMIFQKMISGYKQGYMFFGLLLTKVFEHFKLSVNQLPHFQVASTISDKDVKPPIALGGLARPPHVINLDPVEDARIVPSTSVKSASKMDFENAFEKLQESHNELEKLFKELENSFKNLCDKYEATEARVRVLVSILGNTISRAGRIEDGLSQMINVQLGLVDIPFLPLLEEIVDEPPVMAQGAIGSAVRGGVSDMETDMVNDQISDPPGMENID